MSNEPEKSDIPVAIAVQILETVRQSAIDSAATRDAVQALRNEVLPVVKQFSLAAEARAKADAEADADAIAAHKKLSAAQVDQRAEELAEQTRRNNRVDALVSEVAKPENVKTMLKWLAVFIAGGGVASGGNWIDDWLHPPAPVIQQIDVISPLHQDETPNKGTESP
jgi:hypothetical protein